jgi:hypothetical protein
MAICFNFFVIWYCLPFISHVFFYLLFVHLLLVGGGQGEGGVARCSDARRGRGRPHSDFGGSQDPLQAGVTASRATASAPHRRLNLLLLRQASYCLGPLGAVVLDGGGRFLLAHGAWLHRAPHSALIVLSSQKSRLLKCLYIYLRRCFFSTWGGSPSRPYWITDSYRFACYLNGYH